MRKLFAVLLVTVTASANEVSYRSLQSGSPIGPTPLHDRGLRGEGQLIAVIDTGLDYESCYFAEPDGTPPPFNTGTPGGGLDWQNIDLTRRKVVAYNFLYSCDQYPGFPGCDAPGAPGSLDNQGHGTRAAGAAVGDRNTPETHEYGDSVAPAAKLIVQDGGYVGGDACAQFPGLRCPLQLTPAFEQAYKQGARIHSNSWGDRQGVPAGNPPRANYPQSARDVDAFVWSHPDSLVVFNTGNLASGLGTISPPSALSAPGSAKNTLQVGGTRRRGDDDDVLAQFTLFGPTRDGRIKPDLVGPARVIAAYRNTATNPGTCKTTQENGTSWASPSVAGAAALVRQYYTEGFYPTGTRNAAHAWTPSAALLKATLIAAARPVLQRWDGLRYLDTEPVPSSQQGWGFPVLDDALHFTGETRRLRVVDVPLSAGLAPGQSATVRINVKQGTPLKVVLVWTDPPGTVRPELDATPQLVNDLDLRVTGPGGPPNRDDHLNNVEAFLLDAPAAGTYEVTVTANRLGFGPRQSYALVITGDFTSGSSKARSVRH